MVATTAFSEVAAMMQFMAAQAMMLSLVKPALTGSMVELTAHGMYLYLEVGLHLRAHQIRFLILWLALISSISGHMMQTRRPVEIKPLSLVAKPRSLGEYGA